MSKTAVIHETPLLTAEPPKLDKASSFQKPSTRDNLTKPATKKKVTWQVKEQLHLKLQAYPKQGSRYCFNHPNSICAGTPVFSPLRLTKVRQSTSIPALEKTNKEHESKRINTISLSSKTAYQFIPTLNVSASSSTFSPLIFTATPNKGSHVDSLLHSNSSGRKHSANSSAGKYKTYNNVKVDTTTDVKNSRNNCFKNDYSNNYIHSGKLPYKYVRNAKQQVEGYPKLQKLYRLKEQQIKNHAIKPYGARVKTENLINTLNSWVYNEDLQFDVIMIGALTENQLIYPLLSKLPIDKLCSKPGFLFIWASTQKISELSTLMNDSSTWSKRFRRSEELVFIPVDKNSVYYPKDSDIPENQLFEEVQWHCWMCITGTVRRSTDQDLIHCNVNTDLAIENSTTGNSATPSQIYKVVENFSSSTRRLHIIPTSTGLNKHISVRPGWVIVSPDVILDNFDPVQYKMDLERVGEKLPFNEEIEQLRPKTPV